MKDAPELKQSNTTLTDLRKLSIRSCGYFNVEIEIDHSKFNTDISVIDDNSVSFDIIFGHQGVLTVSPNGITM